MVETKRIDLKFMKNVLKIVTDICMMVCLLCLMAYQVIGASLHEWIGIGMTLLLILHHVLNVKWYGVLFKGKYNKYRTVSTIVNFLLLFSIALTAFCGMSMSSVAVPFLYGMADIGFAQKMHLALSFWSFIFMGLHLGLHLPTLAAKLRLKKTARVAGAVAFAVIAGLGLWLFIQNGIPGYLTFQTHFIFWDYDRSPIRVFAENLAELVFFVFVGACLFRILTYRTGKRKV